MNVLGLLLALVFGALLTSCEQKSAIGDKSDHEKLGEIHQALYQLYDRFTYGKAENPCVAIGTPQNQNPTPQNQNCFYVMTILQEKDSQDFYIGRFSDRACDQNMRSGNPFEKCDPEHWKPAARKFKVNGNPPLAKGKDYDLYSQPDSDALTCHNPDTPDGKPTTTCVERTKPLPQVP